MTAAWREKEMRDLEESVRLSERVTDSLEDAQEKHGTDAVFEIVLHISLSLAWRHATRGDNRFLGCRYRFQHEELVPYWIEVKPADPFIEMARRGVV